MILEKTVSSSIQLDESHLKDSIEPKKVLAVGPDVKDIKPGDTVLYKFYNTPYVVEDPVLKKTILLPKQSAIFSATAELNKQEVPVTYFLVRASDVLAVYESDK